MDLLLDWPFFAIACGLVGVLGLLAWPRASGRPVRWRDPQWLPCLMLPVYMVHQFEEHGFDLLGRRYHFLVEMCGVLGHPSVADCPADRAFIFAVNVGAVWLAGACAILWRRKNPLVGACAFGIPLVNGVIHLGTGLAHHSYNAGLLTGAILFLPLCAWVLRAYVQAGCLRHRQLVWVVASGIAVHAVLMGALLGMAGGLLPRPVMLAVQVVNGFVPLLSGTIAARFSPASPLALG